MAQDLILVEQDLIILAQVFLVTLELDFVAQETVHVYRILSWHNDSFF